MKPKESKPKSQVLSVKLVLLQIRTIAVIAVDPVGALLSWVGQV